MSLYCPKCGRATSAEELLNEQHHCGEHWLCYEELNGDPDDPQSIYAFDPTEAAERFAERDCHRDSDAYGLYEQGTTVHVRQASGGPWHAIQIYCSFDPNFRGYPRS